MSRQSSLVVVWAWLAFFSVVHGNSDPHFATWAGVRRVERLGGGSHAAARRRYHRATNAIDASLTQNDGEEKASLQCTTYRQRYANPNASKRGYQHMGDGNRQNLASKFVVVLQMHRHSLHLKEDLIAATRTLAKEVQESGFHFYILYQVPLVETENGLEQQEMSLEGMLAILPPDFRDVIIFHNVLEDFYAYYPKITERASEVTLWGPGHRAPHAAMSHFMNRYKMYQFAYAIEFDCRLLGHHWGKFLAASLQSGIASDGNDADATEGISISNELPDYLPSNFERLPDLLAFSGIWKSDKWLDSQIGFAEDSLEEMRAMIYGGSRALFNQMHSLSREGRTMYIESLLPAISRLVLKGKTVAIKITQAGESFHCCSKDATSFYTAFYKRQSSSCISHMLLHPIKNNEAFWPNATWAQM